MKMRFTLVIIATMPESRVFFWRFSGQIMSVCEGCIETSLSSFVPSTEHLEVPPFVGSTVTDLRHLAYAMTGACRSVRALQFQR